MHIPYQFPGARQLPMRVPIGKEDGGISKTFSGRELFEVAVRHEMAEFPQPAPINQPARKTSTPPTTTWNTAESNGVSIYLLRIHEMIANSAATTTSAIVVAR